MGTRARARWPLAAKPGLARAKPGLARAKPGLAARAGSGATWAAAALAAFLTAACGARDGTLGPEDFEPVQDTSSAATSSSGQPPPPSGVCSLCDTHVQCNHCLIQAYEDTYRCPPGVPAPAANCMDLHELHRDQYGEAFTCYYCP